jgi:hypothetical protein
MDKARNTMTALLDKLGDEMRKEPICAERVTALSLAISALCPMIISNYLPSGNE